MNAGVSTITAPMEKARIADLLQPFLAAPACAVGSLTETQFNQISTYIDLLLKWNARINLTALRDPENIVTRHFGESLFAGCCLFSGPTWESDFLPPAGPLLDFGSGAGFPGLPIKIWCPKLNVTLLESNSKKATFLREAIRATKLTGIDVFSGRAQSYHGSLGSVVTLRAVERFEESLPDAADLVSPRGRLALLIGEGQVALARRDASWFEWQEPVAFPLSRNRVLLIGVKA